MRNCSHLVSAALLIAAMAGSAFAESESTITERTETRVETAQIPAQVHYEFSRNVGPGRVVKVQDALPGEIKRTYRISFRNGKPVGRELIKEERTEPQHAIFHMGREGYRPSRGAFVRSRVLTMEATAYDPSPRTIGPRATGRTRNGMIARFGLVAVDPRVIPLGTKLFVEGYGFALAADTGGAIKGNKIDLCFATRREALNFGRRQVRVHILKPR
jgi:3D (Asp-Asp-Asp) domain-containing protein